MRTDIRFAGISPSVERRVCLAASTLAAYKIQAQASAWEGIGCNLVVLDLDDVYGQHVAEIAIRRGVKVIAVGSAQPPLPGQITRLQVDASARRIGDAMLQLLAPKKFARVIESRGTPIPPAAVDEVVAALTRVFPWAPLTNELAGVDARATNGSRQIYLCRDSGRIRAHTLSDMLYAMDNAGAAGWTLERMKPIPTGQAETTRSLDVFFLKAALQCPEGIEHFGDSPYRLESWPDLAGAVDSIDSLKIASMLAKSPVTIKDIATRLALSERLVNAHLWAFQASGLLRQPATADAPRLIKKTKTPSFLTRLAAHFGLARKAS